MISSWTVKSNSTSTPLPEYGISDVVSPRAVTYRLEFHQWFDRGSRPSRVLPTIWVHRCTVSRVGCHCSSGREGQLIEWFPSRCLVPHAFMMRCPSLGGTKPLRDVRRRGCGRPDGVDVDRAGRGCAAKFT